jgi:hypothetical protein
MRIQFVAFLFSVAIVTYGDMANCHEISPKSHVFLANDISAESQEIILKILANGYIPTSDELIQLHYCNIKIEKYKHIIDMDINTASQIIQSEISTSPHYTLSEGLKRLYESVVYKEITNSEMESMRESIDAIVK